MRRRDMNRKLEGRVDEKGLLTLYDKVEERSEQKVGERVELVGLLTLQVRKRRDINRKLNRRVDEVGLLTL